MGKRPLPYRPVSGDDQSGHSFTFDQRKRKRPMDTSNYVHGEDWSLSFNWRQLAFFFAVAGVLLAGVMLYFASLVNVPR